jgi:hypothetical protein
MRDGRCRSTTDRPFVAALRPAPTQGLRLEGPRAATAQRRRCVIPGRGCQAAPGGIPTVPVAAQEPNDHIAVILVMKPTPIISEKKAAIWIWIGAAVFTIGAMIFGH